VGGMSALDREFTVSYVMHVSPGMAIANFPDFPRAGVLVILDPPSEVTARELIGHAASILTATGASRTLEYQFWQVNHRNEIGLLFANIQPGAIPLKSRISFVKKAARNDGG
jgi:hypothetical protein